MMPSPFFIMGSARSGTTLLSMLLSRHPRLEVLAETNFYTIFQPLRKCYEPLSNPRSLARFVGEVADLARHIVPFPISAKDMLSRVEEPTFPGSSAPGSTPTHDTTRKSAAVRKPHVIVGISRRLNKTSPPRRFSLSSEIPETPLIPAFGRLAAHWEAWFQTGTARVGFYRTWRSPVSGSI